MNDVEVVEAVLRQAESGLPRSADAIARKVVEALRTDTVRKAWAHRDEHCGICDQHVNVRGVTLNQLHVESLALAYDEVGGDTDLFIHAPTLVHRRASRQVVDFSMLAHFGLTERLWIKGQDTRGLYRITDIGARFLHGNASVPKSIKMFNLESVGVGPGLVTVDDVWGRTFDINAISIRADGARSGPMAVA